MNAALVLIALVVLAQPLAARAQVPASRPVENRTGEASLSVFQSLQVGALNATRVEVGLSGATLSVSAIGLRDAPALIQVTGDANRVYRIQIAGPAAVTEALRIVSANSGDVTVTNAAAMDGAGRDLLQITGDVAALCPDGCTDVRVPLSIAYE